MTKAEALKMLTVNTLVFSEFGLQTIPVDFVHITSFCVFFDAEKDIYKAASILGLLKPKNAKMKIETEYATPSFIVSYNDEYYFRDSFVESMRVIKAIQILNNYSNCYTLEIGY